MDRFAELKAFSLVASTGGFSSAARHLGMAPSSVVRLIDALEKRLGATLLNRSTRSVTLTDSGRVYFENALGILETLEAADNAASAQDREPQGLLRITAPVALGTLYIAPILSEMNRRYPKLQLEFYLNDSFSNIVDESIDVAIRISTTETQPNLIARLLTHQERLICASPAYLAAHGVPQRPSDLLQHNCVVFPFDMPRRGWRFQRNDDSDAPIEEVDVSGNLSVNNSEMLLSAIVDGIGVAMLADWLVRDQIAAGTLVRVLEGYCANPGPMGVGVYAMYPASRRGSAKVKAFVDMLAQHFERTLSPAIPVQGSVGEFNATL